MPREQRSSSILFADIPKCLEKAKCSISICLTGESLSLLINTLPHHLNSTMWEQELDIRSSGISPSLVVWYTVKHLVSPYSLHQWHGESSYENCVTFLEAVNVEKLDWRDVSTDEVFAECARMIRWVWFLELTMEIHVLWSRTIITVLGKWRLEDPWDLLTNQPVLSFEAQVLMRDPVSKGRFKKKKKGVSGSWRSPKAPTYT